MKYLETIDCSIFKIKGKYLTYIKGEHIYVYPDKVIEGKFFNFTLDENYIYTYNNAISETEFYDIESLGNVYNDKNYLGVRYDIDFRNEKKTIFGQYEDDKNEYWAFILRDDFSIERKYIVTIENGSLFLVSDFTFLSKNNEYIALKNIENNIILWQHSFTDLLEGKEIRQAGHIVVYNKKLYFYLYDDKDGRNTATICINIDKGNIEHIYKGFGGDLFLSGNKIGAAAYETVQILDTETNEFDTLDVSSILKPHDIKLSWNRNIFTEEGLLYFTGAFEESKNKIGIIDLNTKELLWYTSFDIPESKYNANRQVMSIQLHNSRLYVHCSDNTLHIFEKK